MYSQCPDCQTRFRVTADALRAAHGTVRCGRCGSAFDALERLSDAIPPPAPDQAQPVPIMADADVASVPEPTASEEYHFSAEDLERVFVDAGDWRDQVAAPAVPPAVEAAEPEPAEQEGAEPPMVVVDEEARVEDITLEGERIRIEAPPDEGGQGVNLDSTDEFEILRHVPDSAYPEEDEAEPEIESLLQQLQAAPAPAAHVAEAAEQGRATEPAAEASVATDARMPDREPVEAATAEDDFPLSAQGWGGRVTDGEPAPVRTTATWRTLGWTLGSLALALALAAQVIHHYRQDLVRHPQLGPPLRATYDGLGLGLLPNWDLAAFELRQWGNNADAAAQGRMVVRASLTNRATFAQPHPILRLELEDRFGATVATRDFEPADYLKNPSQATRLIAPGSSSEAELLLADPGRDAVGYRLDVCLRESASLLRCARGPG